MTTYLGPVAPGMDSGGDSPGACRCHWYEHRSGPALTTTRHSPHHVSPAMHGPVPSSGVPHQSRVSLDAALDASNDLGGEGGHSPPDAYGWSARNRMSTRSFSPPMGRMGLYPGSVERGWRARGMARDGWGANPVAIALDPGCPLLTESQLGGRP